MVERAGCEPRGPRAAAPAQTLLRSGGHSLYPGDDLCGYRLGDVPVAALGVHDLWIFVRCRAGDYRDVVDDYRDCTAGGVGAVFLVHPEASLSRSRETALCIQHAVGLFWVFAVANHLVWQPAGRDHLLPHAPVWRLGSGGC